MARQGAAEGRGAAGSERGREDGKEKRTGGRAVAVPSPPAARGVPAFPGRGAGCEERRRPGEAGARSGEPPPGGRPALSRRGAGETGRAAPLPRQPLRRPLPPPSPPDEAPPLSPPPGPAERRMSPRQAEGERPPRSLGGI